MKRVTGAATAAALTMAVLGGCGVDTQYENRRYDVSGVTSIKVDSDHDLVEVVGSDVRTVRVHERLAYKTDRDRPKPTHTVKNGVLDLRYRCDTLIIGLSACGVRYRVEVPRGTAVQVDLDSGPLRLVGLTGTVRAHVDSGSVEAEGLRAAAVNITSHSGRIRVSGQAQSMRLNTDSGAIDATGLRVLSVQATTDSGAVRLAFLAPPTNVQARSDSGAVAVRLPDNGVKYRVTAHTDSGGRSITVPQDGDSPRVITASTDSGAVTILPS
ncbi:hypothetical protein DPM19_08295 [Actinomadura craniellae]|uniref:DUF4097 domain-containing protein n=1 Tax=Actinomadura craniellae TaxID=2231787 RepID=A0A365HA05_9ACTN|nr:DUF4097 family beta strand repeat-containing protein [Actinomadura craniellae]RAY15766.1 hypothetical protein DPM19_08295 [Actinomadura craniellae]